MLVFPSIEIRQQGVSSINNLDITMMNLDKFERYPLTFGTTPIQFLPNLSKHLGKNLQIYAKRDDCNSGLAFGGNKLRKLEYIVPDILASGADTLVSIGAIQSNHTRQVAAVAAKLGLKCVNVQENWVPPCDSVYGRVGNILLTRLMGAEPRLVNEGFDIGIRESWKNTIKSIEDSGGRAYPIPAGASVHKFGGIGYAAFAREVAEQEEELGFKFDYVLVCVVTGSTLGGMIVGFAEQGRANTVIGIDASNIADKTRAQVRGIVDSTAELVELGRRVRDDEIIIIPDYAYPAYGVPSEATSEAIRLAARTEAMVTDPVYEGKSMQGLVDLAAKGYFPEGSKILYVHLGGGPALDGYSYYYHNG